MLVNVCAPVKHWNAVTGVLLVRCARELVQLVWTSLSLITRLDSRAVAVRVLHVSGTLKKCQQVFVLTLVLCVLFQS